MQVHLPNPDTEFIEEQLDNGHIKKYIKGRTLGKVQLITFRVDLLNVTNLYQNKQANTMLLRLLINRLWVKEKPNKNYSLRSWFINLWSIKILLNSNISSRIINLSTSFSNFAPTMYLVPKIDFKWTSEKKKSSHINGSKILHFATSSCSWLYPSA